MSDFYDLLDEYLGDATDITDLRVMVRRCWLYDFNGFPIRVWQGQGKLIDSNNNVWLGTITSAGKDLHSVPAISDGRDGSSANYNFSLYIPDLPGQSTLETYEAIKAEQWRVRGRNIYCYLALFKDGEGLRPSTPLSFFKELIMIAPKFSEKLQLDGNKTMKKYYVASILAKDGNFGRTEVPNGTYADTCQKARAKELGVTLDRGCEFLSRLANRTYQLP